MAVNDSTEEAVGLGELLRRHRGAAGLGLREAARESGLAVSHLQRLEAGEVRDPRSRTLSRLAAAYGLRDDQLAELWRAVGA